MWSFEENPMLRRILASKDKLYYKRILNTSTEGVRFLKDLRALVDEFGYSEKTIEYSWRFFDIELFVTFWDEFTFPMLFSFTAVLIVILVITSDITATLVVALCVIMTDIFVAGIIYYWRLALNPIVMLQVILGIGCSVDYSAHIAYAYLIEEPPKRLKTRSEIRKYKA